MLPVPESTSESAIQPWGFAVTCSCCSRSTNFAVEMRRVFTCTTVSGEALLAISIGSSLPLGRFAFSREINASGWLYLSA